MAGKSLWQKITQGLGIGIQMAAPVAPILNTTAAAALKITEAVVLAATNPTPEKALILSFNSLGIPLSNAEVHILGGLAVKVKEKLSVPAPSITPLPGSPGGPQKDG